jgi:broad specificity phosphatase PhoE
LEIVPDIVLKDELMERYFGRLDNEAIYTYAYVWPVDRIDVTHTAFDVESVAAVCTRIRKLIVEDLEQEYAGGNYHVVLTSHADVLQIAQLYGAGAENVGTFSSYRFGNGEVRAMARTVDSLPDPVALPAPQRGTQS